MSDLEKYIRDHRSEFDDSDPAPGHYERFAAKLDELPVTQEGSRRQPNMLKIAAIILLMITLSAVVFDFARKQVSGIFLSEKPEPAVMNETDEAIHYYDASASKQLQLLGTLASGRPDALQIEQSVKDRLQKLDASTAELQKILLQDPDNERIRAAIIRNQQMKNVILSNVIKRISTISEP